MKKIELLLEEIKLLQPVIARQDDYQFKLKALAITIFSGLTVALFSESISLSGESYLNITLIISLSFWLISGVYGADEVRAVQRVREIEEMVRNGMVDKKYDGPKISGSLSFWSLSFNSIVGTYVKSLIHPRSWGAYMLLVTLSWFVKSHVA